MAEKVFAGAIKLPTPQERAAYVRGACGDDQALRQQVESLIQAHDEVGGFMPTDPGEAVITIPDRPLSEKEGTCIGRYKLLQRIGEGGMGVIYMAEQTEPVTRKVALKIIKLGLDTKSVIARFEAERQALAMMEHPNIAKVLDAGATDTGRPYFVMELVKGVPRSDTATRITAYPGAARSLYPSLSRHPARPSERSDPPGHQTVEHPGDPARRQAGAQSD